MREQFASLLKDVCHDVEVEVEVEPHLDRRSFEKQQCPQPVEDLGEGPREPGPPLFVEYLQKIYKKVTEMSIQKPFLRDFGPPLSRIL